MPSCQLVPDGPPRRTCLQYAHQRPPVKSWPPVWVPKPDTQFLTDAFKDLLPPQERSASAFLLGEDVSLFLHRPALLLSLSLLAPRYLGVKPPYHEKGVGERRACSCPAVLLGGSGDAPETLGTSPCGLCCVAGQLAASYQLPDKLQPNPETTPPGFQFVVWVFFFFILF